MKTLALKNPESITADVVLEVKENVVCSFCGEDSKRAVAGIAREIKTPTTIRVLDQWGVWREQHYSQGPFYEVTDVYVLTPFFGNPYRVVKEGVEPHYIDKIELKTEIIQPLICFDCIRQLAKLIKEK